MTNAAFLPARVRDIMRHAGRRAAAYCMWQVRALQTEAVDERSVTLYIIYMYNPLCCEIMKIFTKKDVRTLADSEKVHLWDWELQGV